MRAAVVNAVGEVINVIVADPEKDSIPGFRLVAVPVDRGVDTRWIWKELAEWQSRAQAVDITTDEAVKGRDNG